MNAGTARRIGVAVGAVLVTAGAASAQQEFSAAYARAEELRAAAGDEQEIRAAYRTALTAFLKLSPAVGSDPGWLPAGAFCAWRSEQYVLAGDLFIESMRAGNQDAFHAEHVLRALLAAGRHDELLRWGRDLESRFEAAVWTVLVTDRGLWQSRAWETGGGWLSAGDTERGLWVFDILARADGGTPDSLANLGLAFRHVGRESASESTYRRALGLAPSDAALWNDLGLLLKGAGRWSEAERAFAESRRLEPRPPTGPATTNLGRLAVRGFAADHALDDPSAALGVVLATRPDAGLARRIALDLLMRGPAEGGNARSFPPSPPDSRQEPR